MEAFQLLTSQESQNQSSQQAPLSEDVTAEHTSTPRGNQKSKKRAVGDEGTPQMLPKQLAFSAAAADVPEQAADPPMTSSAEDETDKAEHD